MRRPPRLGPYAAVLVFALPLWPFAVHATDWWFCLAADEASNSTYISAPPFASAAGVAKVEEDFERALSRGQIAHSRVVCSRADSDQAAQAGRIVALRFNIKRGMGVRDFNWTPNL